MQKLKEVRFEDGRKITLKEIRVKDIMQFSPDIKRLTEGFSLNELFGLGGKLLETLSDLKKEDIAELSFSEIEEIEKAFMEINAPFFRRSSQVKELAKKVGIEELLRNILKAFRKDFLQNALNSVQQSQASQEPLEIQPQEVVKQSA